MGMIPLSAACVFWGAFSTFSRKDCRRLCKVSFGSSTYELLADAADASVKGFEIEGEEKIVYTLDRELRLGLSAGEPVTDEESSEGESIVTTSSEEKSEDSGDSSDGESVEENALYPQKVKLAWGKGGTNVSHV
eukprot:g3805.t1